MVTRVRIAKAATAGQHVWHAFGAFTGAGLLRNDPPDRYVFNYRASYAEETAAVVDYLVKVSQASPPTILTPQGNGYT